MFAAEIRRRRVDRTRAFTYWRWHLDEMFVKINGQPHYLWRAVGHEGEVLESYVTKTRDKSAALKFIKKALKRHGSAKRIVTDGLRSDGAAIKDLGLASRQDVGRWANNRAQNSHLPFRRRERAMFRFRQMKSLQKFSSVHTSVHNLFSQDRHLTSRETWPTAPSPWRSGGPSRPEVRPGRALDVRRRQVAVRPTAPRIGLILAMEIPVGDSRIFVRAFAQRPAPSAQRPGSR